MMTSEECDVIVAFAKSEERAKVRSQIEFALRVLQDVTDAIEIGEPEIARRRVELARKILCQ